MESKNKIASSFILCQKTTTIAITAGAQSSSSSNSFSFCLRFLCGSLGPIAPPPPSVVVRCSIQRERSRLKHAELVPATEPPHARASLRSTHTRSDPSSLLILQDFL
jgi:hypothetical protein